MRSIAGAICLFAGAYLFPIASGELRDSSFGAAYYTALLTIVGLVLIVSDYLGGKPPEE